MPKISPPLTSTASRGVVLGICVLLAAITWLVFAQTLTHDFVNYDDQGYVFGNAVVTSGLTVHGIIWAFTQSHSFNWHPLTWISHMLDCQFFGLHAGGHHFTSVLLHSLAVVLLFLVLRQMTGALWRSAFVAAVFAVHPLHVESVAWVAERKDVLSAVFFLLTLGAYTRYVRQPSTGRYLIVALLFALGLMSKPMLVTLPLVLLILDYWPLNRLSPTPDKSRAKRSPSPATWLSLIREKIPLLALSLASSFITLIAQRAAMAPFDQLPFWRRLSNAALTPVVYLWQMIFPLRLAPLYLYPADWRPEEFLFSLCLIVVVSAIAILVRRKRPYFLVGWIWYLIMLLPVVGIVQVGWQAHADRYTYLPQIGLYVLIVWFIADVSASWSRRRELLGAAGGLTIAILAALAFQQASYWRDTESLWRHGIAVTPRNYIAFINLGDALLKKGALDEAISKYQVSLGLSPNHADAENGIASALAEKGLNDEAINHFEKAIAMRPQDSEYHNNFGNALYQKGSVDESILQYRKALELRPDRADLHNAETEFNLANALLRRNQIEEAISHYQQSLEIQPENANTLDHLGTALLRSGRTGAAIDQYKKALQTDPRSSTVQANFAWVLATSSDPKFRDGLKAVELAERARDGTGSKDPVVLRTLAAAYAESGRFPDAIETARIALQLATAQANARLIKTLEKEIALYQAGSPFHEPPR